MLRRMFKFIRDSGGQTIVEFALILPIFLLLLFGIMEGGRVLNALLTVNQAAREGARVAIVSTNNPDILNIIETAVNNQGSGLTVTPTYKDVLGACSASPVAGGNVTVTVTSSVKIITPIVSAFFSPNPYPVVGTATMRME